MTHYNRADNFEESNKPTQDTPTVLFYDTETSGFRTKARQYDDPKQAWVVQLAWIMSKGERVISTGNFIISPYSKLQTINPKAAEVHGIPLADTKAYGHTERSVVHNFLHDAQRADLLVCHNYAFDIEFLKDMIARYLSVDEAVSFADTPHYCTMKSGTEYCALPHARWKTSYKYPKLTELYHILFDATFNGAHDALEDVKATRRCYYMMQKLGL